MDWCSRWAAAMGSLFAAAAVVACNRPAADAAAVFRKGTVAVGQYQDSLPSSAVGKELLVLLTSSESSKRPTIARLVFPI